MLQILGYMFGVYAIVRMAMEATKSSERSMRTLAIFGIVCMLGAMVWLTMHGGKVNDTGLGLP